jgi:hypothetical protein
MENGGEANEGRFGGQVSAKGALAVPKMGLLVNVRMLKSQQAANAATFLSSKGVLSLSSGAIFCN